MGTAASLPFELQGRVAPPALQDYASSLPPGIPSINIQKLTFTQPIPRKIGYN
jgi:hypothetical protein